MHFFRWSSPSLNTLLLQHIYGHIISSHLLLHMIIWFSSPAILLSSTKKSNIIGLLLPISFKLIFFFLFKFYIIFLILNLNLSWIIYMNCWKYESFRNSFQLPHSKNGNLAIRKGEWNSWQNEYFARKNI